MEVFQNKVLNRHCTEYAPAQGKEILICEGLLQLSCFTLLNIECPGSAGVRYHFSQPNFEITDIYFVIFMIVLDFLQELHGFFFFLVGRFAGNCKTFLNQEQWERDSVHTINSGETS